MFFITSIYSNVLFFITTLLPIVNTVLLLPINRDIVPLFSLTYVIFYFNKELKLFRGVEVAEARN